MSNLRVKFENASSAALRAFELKDLVAKSDLDYMEELLQPFTSMVQEAEDLRNKHRDALLLQVEQDLKTKYSELKTKFDETLDFWCGDKDIIGRVNKLRFQFKKTSRAYFADDANIIEDKLFAGSTSDFVTETLDEIIILVKNAANLRQEHEDNNKNVVIDLT